MTCFCSFLARRPTPWRFQNKIMWVIVATGKESTVMEQSDCMAMATRKGPESGNVQTQALVNNSHTQRCSIRCREGWGSRTDDGCRKRMGQPPHQEDHEAINTLVLVTQYWSEAELEMFEKWSCPGWPLCWLQIKGYLRVLVHKSAINEGSGRSAYS